MMNHKTFSEWQTSSAVTPLFTERCNMWVWYIETVLKRGSFFFFSFLSLWKFRDRRGIKTLNYINILIWEKFRSGKHLLEVTILYNCIHVILWTLNNETLQCLILWPVRHFWPEVMTLLFDRVVCALNCDITMENKGHIFSL